MYAPSFDTGKIITFYSFKGGTGRSMALANIACLFAKQAEGTSQRILMIDWDLEAPGLHEYFSNYFDMPEYNDIPGILDYFYDLRALLAKHSDLYKKLTDEDEHGWEILDENLPIEKYIVPNVQPNLDFIKAGRTDENYPSRVTSFDWYEFFRTYNAAISVFAELLSSKYAYSFVDSRTGFTDITGICTMILPEKLVGVFTPNDQSLNGLLDLIRKAIKYRDESADFRPLSVFPLPSRIDHSFHPEMIGWQNKYQDKFEKTFQEAYELKRCDLTGYFKKVQLRHDGYYAYGEKLAVLAEKGSEEYLGKDYKAFYQLLIELDHPCQTAEIEQQQKIPTAFDPSIFVVRGFEQDIFLGLVNSDNENNYLEFNGIYGIGKTAFLQWICYKAKEEGWFSVYIDFELSEYHHSEIFPVLEAIIKQLPFKRIESFNESLSSFIKKYREYHRDIYEYQRVDQSPLEKAEDKLIEAFKEVFGRALSESKVIFCIDNADKAINIFSKFEDKVLKDSKANSEFVLITAAQQPLEKLKLGKLIGRKRLPFFDRDAISEQIENLAKSKEIDVINPKEIADKIFEITLGHPLSNRKLFEFWAAGLKSDQALSLEIAEQKLDQGIEYLIKEVLEECILNSLRFDDAYPPATEILRCISPIHHIELPIFWFTLNEFMGEWFKKDAPFSFYQAILDELVEYHILKPVEKDSYEIEPFIRHLFLFDMYRTDRQRYIKIQKTLAERYKADIKQEQNDDLRIRYFFERLYHYARCLYDENPDEMKDKILEKFEQYSAGYSGQYGSIGASGFDRIKYEIKKFLDKTNLTWFILENDFIRIIDVRNEVK